MLFVINEDTINFDDDSPETTCEVGHPRRIFILATVALVAARFRFFFAIVEKVIKALQQCSTFLVWEDVQNIENSNYDS